MDEALDLADYLPVYFKTAIEEEYISFLWSALESNYDDKKYQFAFLAYHMLMMSFVYFNVWQLRQTCPDDFEKGLIGFARDEERNWLRDTSPFTFSKVNERTVLRLFRLIGCDDSQIGNYRKLVDNRNDAAHANGNIYFRTEREVDAKIRQVLQAVEEIQTYSRPIIHRCYEPVPQTPLPSRGQSLKLVTTEDGGGRDGLSFDALGPRARIPDAAFPTGMAAGGDLAWFILDVVEQMDLREFYGAYREDGWGAAAYDPGMMVGIWLLAYCQGVRSSRRIAWALERDVGFRVVAANQQPDFRTICQFRAEH